MPSIEYTSTNLAPQAHIHVVAFAHKLDVDAKRWVTLVVPLVAWVVLERIAGMDQARW